MTCSVFKCHLLRSLPSSSLLFPDLSYSTFCALLLHRWRTYLILCQQLTPQCQCSSHTCNYGLLTQIYRTVFRQVMARQDVGARISFEANCVQIHTSTSDSSSPSKSTPAYLVLVGRVKWYFHHFGIPFPHLLDRTTAQFNAFQKCRLRGISCHSSLRKKDNYQNIQPEKTGYLKQILRVNLSQSSPNFYIRLKESKE